MSFAACTKSRFVSVCSEACLWRPSRWKLALIIWKRAQARWWHCWEHWDACCNAKGDVMRSHRFAVCRVRRRSGLRAGIEGPNNSSAFHADSYVGSVAVAVLWSRLFQWRRRCLQTVELWEGLRLQNHFRRYDGWGSEVFYRMTDRWLRQWSAVALWQDLRARIYLIRAFLKAVGYIMRSLRQFSCFSACITLLAPTMPVVSCLLSARRAIWSNWANSFRTGVIITRAIPSALLNLIITKTVFLYRGRREF